MIIALKLDRITRSTRDWETLMDYLEKYNINHEIEDSIKELLSDIFEYDSVVNEFFLPVLQNKIDNYFNKIANDTKHDLACEIVIELALGMVIEKVILPMTVSHSFPIIL